MRQLMFIILITCLVGCGNSPVSPPETLYRSETFEQHIQNMKTPGQVVVWLNNFTVYSDPYTGWINDNNWDLTYSLAHDLFKNYIEGYSRGKCASFAAMLVVCARQHHYESGIIVWYRWKNPNNVIGHAEAWVKEKSGKISILSNHEYKLEKYMDYTHMVNDYSARYASDGEGQVNFYDAFWRTLKKKRCLNKKTNIKEI